MTVIITVVRESKFPSSRAEPDPKYHECLKQNRRALNPSPFPVKLENLAISLHYSAVAASYLSEVSGNKVINLHYGIAGLQSAS